MQSLPWAQALWTAAPCRGWEHVARGNRAGESGPGGQASQEGPGGRPCPAGPSTGAAAGQALGLRPVLLGPTEAACDACGWSPGRGTAPSVPLAHSHAARRRPPVAMALLLPSCSEGPNAKEPRRPRMRTLCSPLSALPGRPLPPCTGHRPPRTAELLSTAAQRPSASRPLPAAPPRRVALCFPLGPQRAWPCWLRRTLGCCRTPVRGSRLLAVWSPGAKRAHPRVLFSRHFPSFCAFPFFATP